MKDTSNDKINFTSFSEDQKKKVILLMIEADSRLQQSTRHNCEARDLLGQVSHLLGGIDAKELCGEGGE